MSIPKIIHYIWLGERPMHPLMDQWREGWGRLHPGWDIKIWTGGRDIGELVTGSQVAKSRYPHLLKRCCHLSQRSNIWRYEIIEQFGGLYLDTDFEPIKCIESIIEDKSAFAGKAYTCHGETGIQIQTGCALIGSTPHHPWLREMVFSIEGQDPSARGSLGVGYFTQITSRHPEVHLFEPDIFYSTRNDDQGRYKPPVPHAAYAVHRWSNNWFPNGFAPLPVTT
jgi:mannosyltransferase OCH1-like enzyme